MIKQYWQGKGFLDQFSGIDKSIVSSLLEFASNERMDYYKRIVERFNGIVCRKFVGVQAVDSTCTTFSLECQSSFPADSVYGAPFSVRAKNGVLQRNDCGEKSPEVFLDREAIDRLYDIASTRSKFSFATAEGSTISEKYEKLYAGLCDLSKIIGEKTGRGNANFMIVSPEIAQCFPSSFERNSNVGHIGRLNDRWDVFMDTRPIQRIVLGYRGVSTLDAGLVLGIKKLDTEVEYCLTMSSGGGNYYAVVDVDI